MKRNIPHRISAYFAAMLALAGLLCALVPAAALDGDGGAARTVQEAVAEEGSPTPADPAPAQDPDPADPSPADPAPDPAPEPEPATRVLFVGNSFTYHAGVGIDKMLASMAKADGVNIEADRVWYSGATLSQYAYRTSGSAARYDALDAKLRAGSWDFIVLQEQSTLPIYAAYTSMQPAVEALKARIASLQPAARVLLYMTHGYKDGTRVPVNGKYRKLSVSEMQLRLQAAYSEVGRQTGLPVVPVGMYFERCLLNAGPGLLVSDKKHPAWTGFYLAAGAFFHELTGKLPAHTLEAYPADTQRSLAGVLDGSLSLGSFDKVIKKGAGFTLKAASPTGAPVAYKSLDPKVAKVSAGKVSGRKVGSTVVYAQCAGLRAACLVTVEGKKLHKKKLLFASKSMKLKKGKKAKRLPQVSAALRRYRLTWSSTKPRVARVSASGRVTARRAGSCRIKVRDAVSGKTASYKLRVVPRR